MGLGPQSICITIPKRSSRRPVQKSFGGCSACKARKIKCDEVKPCCLRCVEGGRACPGFPSRTRLRWSSKRELNLRVQRTVSDRDELLQCASYSSKQASTSLLPPDGVQPPKHYEAVNHVENGAEDKYCSDQSSSLGQTTMKRAQIDFSSSLPLQLIDLRGRLVKTYFTMICPIFSTFDSEANLFRSFVKQKWQNSRAMYYALLSMSAAKLGRKSWYYKVSALEYQTSAFRCLHEEISSSSAWTTEILFVVLMLGLSTCWHNISDLGIAHLTAFQNAFRNTRIRSSEEELNVMHFFNEALIYWEMVASLMNKRVSIDESETLLPSRLERAALSKNFSHNVGHCMKPHPWTSIASSPQSLFTRIVRLIQQYRSSTHKCTTQGPDKITSSNILQSARTLETELRTLRLPQSHEIAETGDENTPAIHHVLLAKAYMFANLFQLYQNFPVLIKKSAGCPVELGSWMERGALSFSDSYGSSADWINSLGRIIVDHLEQIPLTSGTSCVQPLLLLVASTSLSIDFSVVEREAEAEVLRRRDFVLDRLTYLESKYLSEPTHQVKLAVMEIFKRLDTGVAVSWIDVLESMGLVTIIG